MKQPKDYIFLVDALKSLPTIGSKSANKIANFIIEQDDEYKNSFIKRISDAINNIKTCLLCNNVCIEQYCEYCSNKNLEKSLCIVLSIEDQQRIEESKNYFGYYHIINCGNDIKKITLEKININQIINQINTLKISEVIIATSFSAIGELVCEFIKNKLLDININIYRLGYGLPLNANIDYIDNDTIRESIINKKKIN